MARDQEPMTDDELDEAEAEIADAFEEARAAIESAGDEEPVPDGGED